MIRGWWQRASVAILWAALAGCATGAAPAPWSPGNLQPQISGWQYYFAITWEVKRQDRGALLEGYITNIWGMSARDLQVLVNGYDGAGQQVGQLIAWGPPGGIQPGDRVFFDVTVPAGAATYDVSVFSWKWIKPPSGAAEPRIARHPGD